MITPERETKGMGVFAVRNLKVAAYTAEGKNVGTRAIPQFTKGIVLGEGRQGTKVRFYDEGNKFGILGYVTEDASIASLLPLEGSSLYEGPKRR